MILTTRHLRHARPADLRRLLRWRGVKDTYVTDDLLVLWCELELAARFSSGRGDTMGYS